MTGKFQESLGVPEIKIPDKDHPKKTMDETKIPSLEELKGKLKEIFENKSPEHNEVPPRIEIPDNKSLDENRSDTVTLEDGTTVKLPNRPTVIHYTSDVTEVKDTQSTRELTDNEKNQLQETLGWTDKQLDKCTIDDTGVIHYRTDNCDLEGKTSETGVPYERKVIEINGVKIEGVFPKFQSQFDTQLPEDKQHSKAYAVECNKNLKEAVNTDPDLRSQFSDAQLDDIENGRTPTGYVWHHNEETGKMQLVKRSDHQASRHTGGNILWGPDSIDISQKGEDF